MKWFNKWVLGRLKKAAEQEREESMSLVGAQKLNTKLGPSGDSRVAETGGTTFTMFSAANGGQVVKFECYDRQTDRHTQRLYIIRDDEDTGKALMDIFVLEGLRA